MHTSTATATKVSNIRANARNSCGFLLVIMFYHHFTCLLDGITLLHAASVTTSAVDTDKDDSHPSIIKKIEYGEELSEHFKAGQKRCTVTAVKYTLIDKND